MRKRTAREEQLDSKLDGIRCEHIRIWCALIKGRGDMEKYAAVIVGGLGASSVVLSLATDDADDHIALYSRTMTPQQ